MSEYQPQPGRAMPPEPVLSSSQTEADEHEIETALQQLGAVITDVEDVEDVLVQIASLALAAVPGADGAGVTLVRLTDHARQVLAWSVTDPVVREIDHLQYDVCSEGPCLTAMQARQVQVSGSLGSDTRWPKFGARVARMAVHSSLALPLLARDSVVGAINIYARERDVFTEHSIVLGDRFSAAAAILVHNTRMLHAARAHVAQLQTALTSRATIDQAIGIVRSRSGGSEQDAFDRLRRISQTENVKLSVVAQQIIDEAVRRAHARLTRE